MDLYKIKKDTLEPIDRDSFNLEKDIQSLVEKNIETLFNLEFISTEFSVGDFRLDSLCFDNETNSFVVIEYKKGSSYSVIDQGYSYMSVMLNNKSDFILEYIEKTGKTLKKSEVDFSQSRIIFISPSFNSYQKNSVNFKDVPFELWEIKKYSNGTVSLNQHLSSSKESIQKIEGGKNSIIKDVGKEVKSFEESDHTSKSNKSLIQNWERLKEKFNDMEGVEVVPKKNYITLMCGYKTVAYFIFRKDKVLVEMGRGNLNPDGSTSKNFFNMDDPKKVSIEKSWTWKSGTKGNIYKIEFRKDTDVEYLIYLIKQKHKNILN
tara:strand:+ start:537 stop:1493 length:957 start_codon:yes stop_codon:yes gene_type:complete